MIIVANGGCPLPVCMAAAASQVRSPALENEQLRHRDIAWIHMFMLPKLLFMNLSIDLNKPKPKLIHTDCCSTVYMVSASMQGNEGECPLSPCQSIKISTTMPQNLSLSGGLSELYQAH